MKLPQDRHAVQQVVYAPFKQILEHQKHDELNPQRLLGENIRLLRALSEREYLCEQIVPGKGDRDARVMAVENQP